MTPRLIRWAATWWCAQVVLHFAVLMFYIFMSADCFVSLDNESMYPEPNFSWCFYMECLVIMCTCTNGILGMTLMKMWPESQAVQRKIQTTKIRRTMKTTPVCTCLRV